MCQKRGADIIHEDERSLNDPTAAIIISCAYDSWLPYYFLGVRLPPVRRFLQRSEDPTMQPVKQASKRKKRSAKGAVPVLGAAGLTFALAGSASGSAVPTAGAPQT